MAMDRRSSFVSGALDCKPYQPMPPPRVAVCPDRLSGAIVRAVVDAAAPADDGAALADGESTRTMSAYA